MEKLTFESGEYYSDCYNTIKQKSGQIKQSTKILFQCLPPVIQRILQTNSSSQFNILSVGSGDGDADLRVLKIVEAELQRDERYQNMKIFNRAVEPNHHHINIYKKTIETLPNSLKDKTTFDFRQQTFQEYLQEQSRREDLTKFHLIHFYHSMYYVDVDQTLKYCFEKELQEDGEIMVVGVERDITIDVLKAVHEIFPENKLECYHIADEVIKVVLQNGWKYDTFIQECFLDVTEVFDKDSVDGNRLLDFSTHFVNFRAKADEAHLDKILSVIRDNTVMKDGKRLGNKNDIFVVIRK